MSKQDFEDWVKKLSKIQLVEEFTKQTKQVAELQDQVDCKKDQIRKKAKLVINLVTDLQDHKRLTDLYSDHIEDQQNTISKLINTIARLQSTVASRELQLAEMETELTLFPSKGE